MSTPATDKVSLPDAPRAPTPEESSRSRVMEAHEKVLAGHKLEGKFAECRWGTVDNLVVAIKSLETGAYYLIDRQTGTFWRTLSPDTPTKLTTCSPREVVQQDRAWLFSCFKAIPGGEDVLRRYPAGGTQAVPARPALASPAPSDPSRPESNVVGPAALAALGLVGLKVEKRQKRTVFVEEEGKSRLAPHQVAGILRLSGAEIPEGAEVRLSVDEQGYVVATWKSEEWEEEAS